MLTAQQANQFTQTTINTKSNDRLIMELQRAENQIRSRINAEKFELSFNATVLGNPTGNPIDDSNLTDNQILFRDHFLDDGYTVSLDPNNGNWLISWSETGAEINTHVYSVRTTVTPGAVSAQTIASINNFFASLDFVATSKTVLADTTPSSGGDIPETDFGAPDSTFYEYVALVDQQDDTDYSFDLKTWLRASGLGYVDDTRVTGVGGAGNTTFPVNSIDINNGTTTVTIVVGGTGTAVDLITAINANSTLQATNISGDINGPDVLIVNGFAGTLIVTNNVGDILGDIFGLASPAIGVVTDNTEVYKLV